MKKVTMAKPAKMAKAPKIVKSTVKKDISKAPKPGKGPMSNAGNKY